MVTTVYRGEPVVVRWWSFDPASIEGASAVDGVVEIAETPAGSLVLRTDVEAVMCPAGTWGRISWPTPAA